VGLKSPGYRIGAGLASSAADSVNAARRIAHRVAHQRDDAGVTPLPEDAVESQRVVDRWGKLADVDAAGLG
jgi:hypothetical protein